MTEPPTIVFRHWIFSDNLSTSKQWQKIIWLFLLITTLPISPVLGANFNDSIDGVWDDGATWGNTSPGSVGVDYPGSSDNVTIDSHNVTGTTNSCAFLTISGGNLSLGSSALTIYRYLTNVSGNLSAGTSTVD